VVGFFAAWIRTSREIPDSVRHRSPACPPYSQDLVFLKELIEAGKVKSAIDRRYPLSEVPKALRYYGEGRSQGKVVITVHFHS